jgi:hypothetical protein
MKKNSRSKDRTSDTHSEKGDTRAHKIYIVLVESIVQTFEQLG